MLDYGFYNMDCMEGMKDFPDNYFDLAVVDPPYGAGFTEGGGCKGWFSKYHQAPKVGGYYNRFGGRFDKYKPDSLHLRILQEQQELQTEKETGGGTAKKIISWDIAPGREYFNELFRVSRNQIIWGGNYFDLPPTRCFLIWRKLTISENFSMAMAEYAWTSFNDNAKVFEYAPQAKPGEERFHPTQKPVALYEWILNRYAKEGDTILDTHAGSASSLIACHRTRHKFVGFEIDKDYYKLASERLKAEQAQMTVWDYLEDNK